MKSFFFVSVLFCLLVASGCSAIKEPDSGVFDAFHPGGPVYKPQEVVAERPAPSEPPFGTYFETDSKPPATFTDPYQIRGYWAWKRNDWEWINARWVQRPRPGLIWINARSYSSGPRTFWQTGYWQ